MASPLRIDTHHHLYPPRYIAEHGERIAMVGRGIPASVALDWTPERSLETMDEDGVSFAVLSISTPGVWFGDADAARGLARDCNEYGARLVADRKDRFGMFAAIPLPDVDTSLAEIAYALDTLKLDGIGLMTSYGGLYPGDRRFAPVFDELERRKAVVYLHPTAPDGCWDMVPDVPAAIAEFPFDTTRAVMSLLYGGTLARCPSIRFIVSHGGGTVPFLADRIASLARRPGADVLAARVPLGVEHELKKLYYDVVSIAGNPHGMAALRGLVPSSQLLFGSDYPYLRPQRTVDGLKRLALSDEESAAIDHANAQALFPRLAA
jgi:6-methylsalicylate decarboxylase